MRGQFSDRLFTSPEISLSTDEADSEVGASAARSDLTSQVSVAQATIAALYRLLGDPEADVFDSFAQIGRLEGVVRQLKAQR